MARNLHLRVVARTLISRLVSKGNHCGKTATHFAMVGSALLMVPTSSPFDQDGSQSSSTRASQQSSYFPTTSSLPSSILAKAKRTMEAENALPYFTRVDDCITHSELQRKQLFRKSAQR